MSEPLFYQNGLTLTQFSGELIAHVSSELSVKDRWTTFDIFLTSDDDPIWILQGVGRTKIEGESDRYWAIVSKDPSDLLQGILGNEVSRLAKKLLSVTLQNLAMGTGDEDREDEE